MKSLFLTLLIFSTITLVAQDLTQYQKREYVNKEGQVLPYRILYPKDYDKSKKYPLILVLHGAGERGSDNEKQLIHGAKLFLKEENRTAYPCFVIFPQCPEDSYWASVQIDRSKTPLAINFNYSRPVMPPLQLSIELLKHLVDEESIDKSRLYITGLSMGGMGTFEAVYRNPRIFAAALPICGGGDKDSYDKRAKRTSFWVFHGSADAVVDVKLSREMVDKLKELKVPVQYTEYPGVNHNSWDNAFAEPTFLSWMFQHKRKKVKF
jgi:predicted peptidase